MGRAVAILVAVGAAYLLFRLGVGMTRALVSPMPEPPPPGELRKVKLRYRCPVCGMELRVTVAANEEPMPPRHCMDEMDLVSTGDE